MWVRTVMASVAMAIASLALGTFTMGVVARVRGTVRVRGMG